MKMAYIANTRFPSEKAQSDQIMHMCTAFAQLGYEVVLFVPNRRGLAAQDPFAYYGRPPSFRVERVPCLDGTSYYSWFGALGFWVQTITFTLSLRSAVKRFCPDVVYSRDVFSLVWQWSCPRVWEAHAVPRTKWMRKFARHLQGIVTLTQAAMQQFCSFGVPKERLLVEPDAVDPQLFSNPPSREEARIRLGIKTEETLAIYVGKFTTLEQPKGLDEAIEAVRRLREHGRPVRLLAVGGTADELRRYAPKQGEGIELLGHQPQRELKNFYAAADVALMPFPYSEHYAFFMSPLKLFEYLMSGLPMIASDLPSVREIVSEREAWLIEPGSISALEHALTQVMDNPKEAERRGECARKLAASYTWDARAQRIQAFLQTLVSPSSSCDKLRR